MSTSPPPSPAAISTNSLNPRPAGPEHGRIGGAATRGRPARARAPAGRWSPRPTGSDRRTSVASRARPLDPGRRPDPRVLEGDRLTIPSSMRGPVLPEARLAARTMARGDPNDMLVTVNGEDVIDAKDDLPRIAAPTLVISGGKEPFYPPRVVRGDGGRSPGRRGANHRAVGALGRRGPRGRRCSQSGSCTPGAPAAPGQRIIRSR